MRIAAWTACAGATLSLLMLPPACRAQMTDPVVSMQTTKGPLRIRVYAGLVPYTSRSFLDLVQRGFYNGLSFHRVETWCIQGGDPNGNGTGDFVDPQTGRPRRLKLEIYPGFHHNGAGVVAMARNNDPNSASCQFYITKAAMPGLDGQYAIFGTVSKNTLNTVFQIRPGDRILSAEIEPPLETPAVTPPAAPAPGGAPAPKAESGF